MSHFRTLIASLFLTAALLFPSSVGAQFTIKDNDTVFNANQSIWMQADIDTLVNGVSGNGVLGSGCAVTAQGTPDMTVAVGSGTVRINGTVLPISAGNATIGAANSTLPRIDLISINSSGVPVVTAGTAAARPKAPAVPANSAPCGMVYVPAADTAIQSNQITDKRMFVKATSQAVNVQDFGAVPDFTTDSTTAIQNAITAATSGGTGKSTSVIFPPAGPDSACYKITQPLLVSTGNLTFEGSSGYADTGPCIRSSGFSGPLFYISPSFTNTSYSTSLATGSGQSLSLAEATSGSATWINLADAKSTQINGLTAFTAEFFLKVTSVPVDSGGVYVLASSGEIGDGASQHAAFYVKLFPDMSVWVVMKVNGADKVIITGASTLSLNTTYHVSVVFNGSTLKMFYGAPGATTTQGGSTSASGSITQKAWEALSIGGTRLRWPVNAVAGGSCTCLIDSIRLSNTARYSSTYTAPSAKHASDGNTLLLENFDNETSRFSIVSTSNGTTYLPKYPGSATSQIGAIHFRNLQINAQAGIGIWMVGTTSSSFEKLLIRNGIYGIFSARDSYLNVFRDVWFLNETGAQGRAGLALGEVSGITTVEHCRFTAWPVGMVNSAGSITVSDSFFHGDYQIYPLVTHSVSQALLTNNSFSDEDVTMTGLLSSIVLDNVRTAVIMGGSIERFGLHSDVGPAIIINGSGSEVLSMIGLDVSVNASATEVIKVSGSNPKTAIVQNSRKSQSGVPWSTSAYVRTWPVSDLGAPSINTGFGTSPSITGAGADAFRVTIGSGGSASTGTVTLPKAQTGWNCSAADVTNPDSHNTVQTSSTTTSASFKNYSRTTGSATAWTASDAVAISCTAY